MNPDTQSIRKQLDAILESESFARSPRMQRFLRFVVEETLAGRTNQLGEYGIAIAVFDRDPDFEPALDPIVRNDARRLRAKLLEYYSQSFSQPGMVIIEMPKGGYVPIFRAAHGTGEPVDGRCRMVINLFQPGQNIPMGEWSFDLDLKQSVTGPGILPIRLALAA